jgi:hypothetical protein
MDWPGEKLWLIRLHGIVELWNYGIMVKKTVFFAPIGILVISQAQT